MLTVLVLASVAGAAFVAGALLSRRTAARRYEGAVRRVEEAFGPISETLREASERAEEARRSPAAAPGLAPNLERLLEQIADEGAPAHAFRRLATELTPELAETRGLPRAKTPAARDELTGVRDRDGYEAELEREIARATRTERPLSIVLLDLGDLAEARVRAGHAEVDRLLQGFAELLVRVTRTTDTVCRRRGEEFGIVLPETTATGARHFRRRIREETARKSFGALGPVTYSTGVVEWRPNETAEALDVRARMAVAHASVRALGARDVADDGSPAH